MSPLEYLKNHSSKLQKLVDYCKGDANSKTQPIVNSTIRNYQPQLDSGPLVDEEPIFIMLFKEEEASFLDTSLGQ